MPQELTEMKQRAAEVVRLLDEYRRLSSPELDMKPLISAIPNERPPKRPWEDVDRDGRATGGASPYGEVDTIPFGCYNANILSFFLSVQPGSKLEQTTAEQDMEIIRTKRATSSAAGTSSGGGQTKSKYRKRSVSMTTFILFLKFFGVKKS